MCIRVLVPPAPILLLLPLAILAEIIIGVMFFGIALVRIVFLIAPLMPIAMLAVVITLISPVV